MHNRPIAAKARDGGKAIAYIAFIGAAIFAQMVCNICFTQPTIQCAIFQPVPEMT